jgi:cytochrome c-type biogenesis protein CcmH
MILGLILAVMTAAAIFAVSWPFARRAGAARSGSDIAVYRDQLEEVDRDLTLGVIGKNEAEAARVEISRRLLAAANDTQTKPSSFNATLAARRRRTAALVSVLALPILAGGLYLWLGSPKLASEQLLANQNGATAQETVEILVAQAEAHLERNPRDGRGWEIVAPVYMRLDRYSDSVTAWRNSIELLGESAEREANLGEALTAEANGVVTEDAKAAFVRAVTLDQTIVTARYYLGQAAEQDGQRETAAKIWRDLIADDAPEGAFWVGEVRTALSRVENNPTPPPGMAPLGPSADQIAAAANQAPEQQAAMIRGMVDRLAARLKQNGSDADGWVRLVRSLKVLGEPAKARATATDAQRALAGDPDKLQQLNAALKELDLDNAAASPPVSGEMAVVSPSDHQRSMQDAVERLAERLKASGSDPEGWLMLVRSYEVLGERDKATAAINRARHALAGDPDRLKRFNMALKNFNISE